MKTKLILFLLLLVQITVNSQSFYYSANKKNYVTIDSTTIVFENVQNLKKSKLNQLLNSSNKYKRIHLFKNKKIVEIKSTKNISSLDIESKDIIGKYIYGYKIGNTPILFTGEILLEPRNNVNIKDIIDFTNLRRV